VAHLDKGMGYDTQADAINTFLMNEKAPNY
jgi:hypothetical protein